jgi:hypothetical protein
VRFYRFTPRWNRFTPRFFRITQRLIYFILRWSRFALRFYRITQRLIYFILRWSRFARRWSTFRNAPRTQQMGCRRFALRQRAGFISHHSFIRCLSVDRLHPAARRVGRRPAEQVLSLPTSDRLHKAPVERAFVYSLTAFIRLHTMSGRLLIGLIPE